jgi:hypothetical protein
VKTSSLTNFALFPGTAEPVYKWALLTAEGGPCGQGVSVQSQQGASCPHSGDRVTTSRGAIIQMRHDIECRNTSHGVSGNPWPVLNQHKGNQTTNLPPARHRGTNCQASELPTWDVTIMQAMAVFVTSVHYVPTKRFLLSRV